MFLKENSTFNYALTALESVATADVTNIIVKVTMISMIRACKSVPEGVVVPKYFIGWNITFRENEADIDPITCAPA